MCQVSVSVDFPALPRYRIWRDASSLAFPFDVCAFASIACVYVYIYDVYVCVYVVCICGAKNWFDYQRSKTIETKRINKRWQNPSKKCCMRRAEGGTEMSTSCPPTCQKMALSDNFSFLLWVSFLCSAVLCVGMEVRHAALDSATLGLQLQINLINCFRFCFTAFIIACCRVFIHLCCLPHVFNGVFHFQALACKKVVKCRDSIGPWNDSLIASYRGPQSVRSENLENCIISRAGEQTRAAAPSKWSFLIAFVSLCPQMLRVVGIYLSLLFWKS